MHARFEQTSQLSGTCTTADREAGKCYGGFPRVATVVKEARLKAATGQGPPVLYLNAGDTYTGTAWFTIYKWKIAAEFINALNPDAVSLGNNELQKGSTKLSPFLDNLETNILVTNVIVKGQEEKIRKSIVFDIEGNKVGIVGYLTPDASILDSEGNIEYIDEVLALKDEVSNLQALGINIIIALGHADFDKTIEIASEVEGLDLVITGHKNVFSWTGARAETQYAEKSFEVTQKSGKRVPIVESYAYNNVLGKVLAKFDDTGNIAQYYVEPITLNATIPQDSEAVQRLNKHKTEMEVRSEEIVEYFVIDDSREYPVIMPVSMADGEYGYTMLTGLPRTNLDYDEVTCIAEYVRQRSPVYPDVAGRIEFINYLPEPDSASLGNHEFDQGVSGLTPFIENITCPTLAANLILNKEPALYNEPKLMKSVVFDVNGTLVGVIGYLTPDTKILAIRNDVDYMEEVIAIRQEAVRLKHTGVHILIALGHSGFSKDLEIAEKVEYIDLVIGGHTNTFLWNGTSPDVEKPEGPYPTLVKQASGRLVPAVQAYAYTKYLGKLHLVFDSDGEIVSFDGNPVLLDKSVPQDPDVLSIVNRYKDGVMQISNVVVGNTSVVLDGIGCRLNECNLGNLITDAMVQKRAIMYKGNNTSGWTDAPISIIQAGGIRTSISHIKRPANITKGDLLIVLPFEGQTVMVEVNGTTIFKMLERSVENYRTNRPVAPFLQFSGLHVEYNLYNKPGLRVVKALARCGTCDIPEYSMINRTATYRILMPSFLASGGDGYFMFEGLPITYFDYNELDSLTEYLMQHSPVHPAVEGRIVVHRPNTISGAPSLGNHEFDNGIGDLTPFIHHLTCPVLAANLVLIKVPELQQENNLKNSIVIVREGTKIGIIGYLTPETKLHTLPNDVDYIDEIVAIQEETDKLLKDGVNIIIALGHSGYIKDQQIAKEVEGLDLVIGGHSHSLLWNGTAPDSDEPIGPYPTYVTQPSGRIVPVVQAYAYTKYLGKLHVLFNSKGEITFSDGSPILLDKKIPQDPEILEILDRYRYEVDKIAGETIGETSVLLDGNICDKQECNLGNLITDAMLHYYAANYTGEQRADVSIAFLQAGAIRASIDHAKIPAPITKADLLTVLPFKGPLATVKMNGTVLIQMLEHSVSDTDQPRVREFLQMSGLHVVYNYSKPSLGNHEFDEAVEGVVPFINTVKTPVLAANLILDNVPEMQNLKNLLNSTILYASEIPVGVIGYLTPDTRFLAPRNKVEYEDEIVALKREVALLKAKGIKVIIALGHSGFIKDLQIAKEVEDIDLVIGGHSNTFLWNSNTTDEKPEIPQGHYPYWVTQASGRKVPVVQAYAYTKYLGKLHLIFDSNGEIIECDGSPLLLNQNIPRDPQLLELISRYRSGVDAIINEVVGSSMNLLNGEDCRLRECNMGNIITDSILYYTKKYYDDKFPDVNIAIVQGGRIRASISKPGRQPFEITHGDLLAVLPFSDTLSLVSMNGTILMQALEHSIEGWRLIDTPGQFIQVSGIRVIYDLARPPGSRVISAQTTCSNCNNAKLMDVKPDFNYKVLMPSFLADLGDGYSMFNGLDKEIVAYDEVTALIAYMKVYSPVQPTVSNRIIIRNENKVNNDIDENIHKHDRSRASVALTSIFLQLVCLFMI
ncbi:hypothetical protein O0L34_g346 [Tuta absoluta]|nr:hypothetical protein O0L34_g346 [Tuta absoluta]